MSNEIKLKFCMFTIIPLFIKEHIENIHVLNLYHVSR